MSINDLYHPRQTLILLQIDRVPIINEINVIYRVKRISIIASFFNLLDKYDAFWETMWNKINNHHNWVKLIDSVKYSSNTMLVKSFSYSKTKIFSLIQYFYFTRPHFFSDCLLSRSHLIYFHNYRTIHFLLFPFAFCYYTFVHSWQIFWISWSIFY
jgi:hypothetical protein